MLKIIAAALLVLMACDFAQTVDYCLDRHCKGGSHIACITKGEFSPTCHPKRILVDIRPLISKILHEHNIRRNLVAAGYTRFKPAVRMATMQWDDDLAKLAEYNAKRCLFKHDCHHIDKYRQSGQNLALPFGSPGRWMTAFEAVKRGIDAWFREWEHTTQEYLDSYPSSLPPGVVVGHFLVAINAWATHVGCGIVQQPRRDGLENFFVCNYSRLGALDKPSYISGPAASGCITGSNPRYPALCNISEPIDPNDYSQ